MGFSVERNENDQGATYPVFLNVPSSIADNSLDQS